MTRLTDDQARRAGVSVGSQLEAAFAQQLVMLGWPPPVREYVFHPTRRWRLDFAWPKALVAVEVEGGTFVNGAHTRGAHFESDAEKYNEAALAGWKVLRVTSKMVKSGRAIDFTERLLVGSGLVTPRPGALPRMG